MVSIPLMMKSLKGINQTGSNTGKYSNNPDIYYSNGSFLLTFTEYKPDMILGPENIIRLMRSTDLKSWNYVNLSTKLEYIDPNPSIVELNGTIHIIHTDLTDLYDLRISPDGSQNIITIRKSQIHGRFGPEEFLSPTASVDGGTIYLYYVYSYDSGDFVHRIDRHVERIESHDELTWNSNISGARLSSRFSYENTVDSFINGNDTSIVVTSSTSNLDVTPQGYFLKDINGSNIRSYSTLTTYNTSIIRASNGNYYIADDNGLWVSSDDGTNWSRATDHKFGAPSIIQDRKGNIIIAYVNSYKVYKWEYSPLKLNIALDSNKTEYFIGDSTRIISDIVDKDYAIEKYVWISSKDGEVNVGNFPTLFVGWLSPGTHKVRLRVLDNMQVWSESNEITITIKKPVDYRLARIELTSIIIIVAIFIAVESKRSSKWTKSGSRKMKKSM